MNEIEKDTIKKWFEKADNDIKNIENNFASVDVPTDTVCFHAQQSIEKYLKGAFIFFDKDISKTHDLVKLLSEISAFIPELSVFEEELDRVSEFAVEFRYPDALYEPTLEEAKKSYELAIKIKDIILNKIKIWI